MPYYSRNLPDDVKGDEAYFDEKAKAYGDTLGRYLQQNVTPYRPVSHLPMEAPQEPQGPIYQPQAQVPYAAPEGPIYQDQGLGLGDPQGPVYQQPQAPTPNPMAGWANSPDQGGLGLAAGPGYNQPRKPNLGEYLAQEMYPDANLNWMQKNRLAFHATQPDYMGKRQQLAQQLAANEETARQHDLQLFEKAMSSKNPMQMFEALGKMPNYRFSKQAQQALRVLKDSDMQSFKSYQEFIPEEVQQRFIKGELDDYELRAWVDEARTMSTANAKEKVKSESIRRAMDKQKRGEDLSAYELQIINERQDAEELKHAEIDLKKAQADKARKDAEQGNVKFTQMTQEISSELFDKPFESLTQPQRAVVEKEKEKRLQGRTSAMITQGLPAPLKEQAHIYTKRGLDNLELEQAPSGLSEAAYRTGPYRQLDPKEVDAVTEYNTAVKTVDTMNKVADKLITAKNGFQAGKQKLALEAGAATGNNGLAKAYKADMNSFASRMARLVEVGVLTNVDVERWANTFGQFGDTVQALKAKKVLFAEIQNETGRLLRLRLGGKPVTSKERSKLDELLDKADGYNTVDQDFDTLMGGKK
jgi:hypothetical protein